MAARKAKKPPKPKKPKAPPKPKPPKRWAERAQTPAGASIGHEAALHVLTASGAGSHALDLEGGTGLSAAILDLAGEHGGIGLGRALMAWQREQERVANRAWRRPGGMVRMGGL